MSSILRVLVVDDQTDILRSVSRILRRRGFEVVVTVGSAEAAAELLMRTAFDAILTDHDMGGKDGVWLLRQARSLQPNAQRVLMSGRAIPGISELIAEGLVHCFVPKPADEMQLVMALRVGPQAKGD